MNVHKMIYFFFIFRYVDIQPRLQPNHWRLLDAPTPNNNGGGRREGRGGRYGLETGLSRPNSNSLFLSSAMIRHLNSSPLPKNRNASDHLEDVHHIYRVFKANAWKKRFTFVSQNNASKLLYRTEKEDCSFQTLW